MYIPIPFSFLKKTFFGEGVWWLIVLVCVDVDG